MIGYDSIQGDYQWRVEKRALSSGALATGFGTGGAVTSNPSSGNDYAYGAVSDGTNLYVVGAERGASFYLWRVEKRSMASGGLVSAFGSSGVLTIDPSTLDDDLRAALADSSALYLVGWDLSAGTGDMQWRIEKRSLSDGSLVTGFGTSGVVTSNPTSGNDQARVVCADGTNLYVAGWDAGSGTRGRIEKLTMAGGAYVTGFGTSGVLTTAMDGLHAIATDGTYLYVAGSDSTPGDAQWHIEKRSASTGALVATFGTLGIVTANPGGGVDLVRGLALDASGLYAVGAEDAGSGDVLWRVEKRSR